MMKTRLSPLCALLMLCSTACTHLETRPSNELPTAVPGAAADNGAQRGLSYALPMLQYDLKIVRSLEKCPEGTAPPEFAIKAEAAERYRAGERFEIDYRALSSVLKSTNFQVEFHESGTIKSINAKASDKTGTVLVDVARIGIAAASAAGNPLAATQITSLLAESQQFSSIKSLVPGGQTTLALRCTPAAVAALAALNIETGEVKRLTREVAGLSAAVSRIGELAALRIFTPADKIELADKAKQLLAREQDLRDHKALLARAQAGLSAEVEESWPRRTSGVEAHLGELKAERDALSTLSDLFQVVTISNGVETPVTTADLAAVPVFCGSVIRSALSCVAEATAVTVALEEITVAPEAVTYPQTHVGAGWERNRARLEAIVRPTDDDWSRGVFVREPAAARLIVCSKGATPSSEGCSKPGSTVLRDKIVVAPQLGRLRLLDFTNGPFEDNEIKLAVRANGLIDTFRYGEESAAASASTSLADMSEKIAAGIEKLETERRDDVKYARDTVAWQRTEAAAVRAEEIAQATFEIDKLKKQKERLDAQAALSPPAAPDATKAEMARLDAETALLQSRIARAKAAAELAGLPPT